MDRKITPLRLLSGSSQVVQREADGVRYEQEKPEETERISNA